MILMAKFKIVRKGWDKQNDVIPVILLSKADRDSVKAEKGQPVKVIKRLNGEVSFETIAIVQMQFKEHLDKLSSCTVNDVLANRLNVGVDDSVEISKMLTETEYNNFMKDLQQSVFFGF